MMLARALLALLALPGLVGVFLPPLVGSLDPWRGSQCAPGLGLILAGAVAVLQCARDFYRAGRGTLAPWDPPRQLVKVGLYRHVRNPMYLGVLLMVLGWSIYLSSPLLVAYLVALAVGFHLRVVMCEEPWLAGRFPKEWDAYRAEVPRWLPRIRPAPDL